MPELVDRMMPGPRRGEPRAPCACSRRLTGRSVGGSTGTNVWGALALIAEMRRAGTKGSVVTLICDGGDRYQQTYYSDEWIGASGLDVNGAEAFVRRFLATGEWD